MTAHNPPVPFLNFIPHLVALSVVALGLLMPDTLITWVEYYTDGFLNHFDWLILLATNLFLGLCIYLMFSRYGRITLGVDGEEPHFTTPSWLAMLFAAGMGSGLVFWGTAEPLQHMMQTPVAGAEPGSRVAIREAFSLTNLHWALHPWAIYGFCALAIAYFTFRKNQPLLVSAPMRATPRKTHVVEAVIDAVALLSIVFGLVASLGQGVMQVTSGMALLVDTLEVSESTYIGVVLVLAACYLLSASGGINRGIKPLSDLNMILCILLMLFILCSGPTVFLLRNAVASFGHYLSNFIDLSFALRHLREDGNQWTHNWTLTYFLWWVSWGPFVGVFVARISRGRTIREFLTGVLLVPAAFSIIWFAIIGGAGVYVEMHGAAALSEADYSMATYMLLAELPWPQVTQAATVFLVFIFLVTSADSGTYVLGMFSSHGNPNPPRSHCLFWGVMIALMVMGALLTGKGIDMLRALIVVGAAPFLFIMLWQGWCLLRSLKRENIPYMTGEET